MKISLQFSKHSYIRNAGKENETRIFLQTLLWNDDTKQCGHHKISFISSTKYTHWNEWNLLLWLKLSSNIHSYINEVVDIINMFVSFSSCLRRGILTIYPKNCYSHLQARISSEYLRSVKVSSKEIILCGFMIIYTYNITQC